MYCKLDDASIRLLKSAMERLNLSTRAYDRILKISRTIADLEGANDVLGNHISEAIQYRNLNRECWLGDFFTNYCNLFFFFHLINK